MNPYGGGAGPGGYGPGGYGAGGGGWGPPGGYPPGGGYPGPQGSNPYAAPSGGYGAPGFPPGGGMAPSIAKSKVAPPAIVMMVVTGIGLLLRGFFTLYTGLVGGAMFASMPRGAEGVAGGMVFLIVASIFSLGIGVFCMYGLYKMTQLESWGLSLAAVIVSMIPCIGPCCYFSINTFIGIWALVVLNDSQVKSAFKG